ncbi:hypothetical protein OG921_03970 [Aldersonia sp. NBC_00410]|uniref:hypothetical protein n=1 Tax=Aldersonia sp. NBC_00410 TaxID=2975954 RepID=UPI0022531AC1|nr:hypothetical protein [Aldersonia sp. NBC_00410]MCX5042344.1 hypothetical protein [Aldersonia sp. NBC_00410]
MSTLLEGQRIVVTGAATGIGAAAVEVLSAAGHGRGDTSLHPTPNDLPAFWLRCDGRDPAMVTATVGASSQVRIVYKT